MRRHVAHVSFVRTRLPDIGTRSHSPIRDVLVSGSAPRQGQFGGDPASPPSVDGSRHEILVRLRKGMGPVHRGWHYRTLAAFDYVHGRSGRPAPWWMPLLRVRRMMSEGAGECENRQDEMGRQTMTDRRFRFGVVAGQVQDLAQWTGLAKHVEDMGYDTLLSPDTFNVAAPFVSLAAAVAATIRLRVGTFVLVAPFRSAASIAWDTASVDRLSGGRFELGLGAGRPDAVGEAELLGLPWGSPGRRIEQLDQVIAGVRSIFTPDADVPDYLRPTQLPHPPIMVAGAGPKLLALAARQADIVALGIPGNAGEDQLGEKVRVVREQAGDRFDDIELSVNTFAVGDVDLPPWMVNQFGVDPALTRDNQSIAVLTGDTDTIVDVLQRRRDRFGVSYVTVNAMAMDAFAPVVERLAGH
jgi:probable F420-dependent oxidoreductase